MRDVAELTPNRRLLTSHAFVGIIKRNLCHPPIFSRPFTLTPLPSLSNRPTNTSPSPPPVFLSVFRSREYCFSDLWSFSPPKMPPSSMSVAQSVPFFGAPSPSSLDGQDNPLSDSYNLFFWVGLSISFSLLSRCLCEFATMLLEELVARLCASPRHQAAFPFLGCFPSPIYTQNAHQSYPVQSPPLSLMADSSSHRLDLRVGGKYRLGKKIGSGSFGTL
jgi:hypothetical protein